jgi:hypothetical protein
MFLGQFKPVFKDADDEPKTVLQKPPGQEKSSSAEDFVKTPEAREFVSKWMDAEKDGEQMYTRRGIVRLLTMLFPVFDSNRKVLSNADELLKMLGGMDGLQGFLMGWKAKSEGIIKGGIKGLQSILGGK